MWAKTSNGPFLALCKRGKLRRTKNYAVSGLFIEQYFSDQLLPKTWKYCNRFFLPEQRQSPRRGSSIQSVVVSFSDVTVYSQTTAGFSTNYFEVSLDLDSAGSQTQVAYSVSSALLNFTGGSITFTVWGGVSSTSNVLNVRTGCTITITVNYSAASKSTGYLSASSIAQGSATD